MVTHLLSLWKFFMDWLCGNKGHSQLLVNVQHSCACLTLPLFIEVISVRRDTNFLTFRIPIYSWAHTWFDTMNTRAGWESQPNARNASAPVSMALRSVCVLPHHYTASQPTPRLEFSSLGKPQVLLPLQWFWTRIRSTWQHSFSVNTVAVGVNIVQRLCLTSFCP
jgi:hypothetical protein